MKLSVNTYCLPEKSANDALAAIRSMGYTAIELVGLGEGRHVEYTVMSADDVRALVEPHGLELAALYMRPINIHAPEKLERSLADLEHVIDLAGELGVGRIVFSPLIPREPYDYRLLADGCARLARRIGNREIDICLENHHNWPLSTAEDYERLLEIGLPERVGFTVDTGHFYASGVDVPAFVRKHRDRVRHVHIKDHDAKGSVELGTGETPLPAIFDALREIGYDGYCSVEVEIEGATDMVPVITSAFRYCTEELGIPAS